MNFEAGCVSQGNVRTSVRRDGIGVLLQIHSRIYVIDKNVENKKVSYRKQIAR